MKDPLTVVDIENQEERQSQELNSLKKK